MKTQKGIYKNYKELLNSEPTIGRLYNFKFFEKNKHGNIILSCECKCGNKIKKYFSDVNITKGKISCGCWQKEIAKKIGENNQKYFINESSLVDNETTSYISGILAADGWIYSKQSIGISLSEKDKDVLEKIKKYLNYTGILNFQIRNKTNINWNNHYKLVITNKYFFNFFNKRGIIKNKTYNYVVPENYIYNSHFWRGAIDGDGCIFNYTYNKYRMYGISLVGTKDMIINFEKFCQSIVNTKSKIREFKNSKGLFEFRITGTKVLPILIELYKDLDKSIYMERKYNKYKEIFKPKTIINE